jgi:hypothetical protein
MRWSDIPFSPPERTLRQFAGLWIAFFGAFALWQGLAHGRLGLAFGLAVVALVVGVLGLVRPSAIRPIFISWMVLAFPIGWVVSHVLLGMVFFGLFTPLGLLFRASGRDLLALKPHPDVPTYWEPKPVAGDVRRYFRQF